MTGSISVDYEKALNTDGPFVWAAPFVVRTNDTVLLRCVFEGENQNQQTRQEK